MLDVGNFKRRARFCVTPDDFRHNFLQAPNCTHAASRRPRRRGSHDRQCRDNLATYAVCRKQEQLHAIQDPRPGRSGQRRRWSCYNGSNLQHQEGAARHGRHTSTLAFHSRSGRSLSRKYRVLPTTASCTLCSSLQLAEQHTTPSAAIPRSRPKWPLRLRLPRAHQRPPPRRIPHF